MISFVVEHQNPETNFTNTGFFRHWGVPYLPKKCNNKVQSYRWIGLVRPNCFLSGPKEQQNTSKKQHRKQDSDDVSLPGSTKLEEFSKRLEDENSLLLTDRLNNPEQLETKETVSLLENNKKK